MSSQPLTHEQNERVRALVRSMMHEGHGATSEVARDLGVESQTISQFLSGKNGAGPKLIEALKRKTHKSYEEIVDGRTRGAASDDDPQVGSLPGYDEAESTARRISQKPAWVFHKLRRLRGLAPPDELTPEWVLRMADVVFENTSREERAALNAKRLDAEVKRHTTRASKPKS